MSSGGAKEFRASKSRTQHGLLLGAMLCVFGLWTMLFAGEAVPDRHWLGALSLVMGSGIALFAWRRGQGSGAYLRMDETGIWFREWGVAVPWRQIDDVYQTGIRLQPFITIRIKDAGAFVASLPDEDARRLRGNRLWKQPEFRIPFGAVEATRQEILDAIETGIRVYG